MYAVTNHTTEKITEFENVIGIARKFESDFRPCLEGTTYHDGSGPVSADYPIFETKEDAETFQQMTKDIDQLKQVIKSIEERAETLKVHPKPIANYRSNKPSHSNFRAHHAFEKSGTEEVLRLVNA